MKKLASLPRYLILLFIGIGVTFMSVAFKSAAVIAQTSVPTPTPEVTAVVVDALEVGSTDGIMVLSVAISLVIILPILANWQRWAKKEAKE
jgi:hypothetical protein